MDTSNRSLAWEEFLGEPQSGDFNQGQGVSTSQLQNPNVSLAGANATGSGFTAPIVAVTILVLLVLIKIVTEKAGKSSEFSSVRIGTENLLIVTLLAALGIYIIKVTAFVTKASWLVPFASTI